MIILQINYVIYKKINIKMENIIHFNINNFITFNNLIKINLTFII
jgi:hypothetical protein